MATLCSRAIHKAANRAEKYLKQGIEPERAISKGAQDPRRLVKAFVRAELRKRGYKIK